MAVRDKFRHAYYVHRKNTIVPRFKNTAVTMRGRKIAHRPQKVANYRRQKRASTFCGIIKARQIRRSMA